MARKRNWLKVIGFVAAGVVAVVLLAYGGLIVVSNSMLARTVEVPVAVEPVVVRDGDPGAIERGRYLANHVIGCVVCHAADFGGRAEVDDAMVGTLWGPNLTSGRGSVTADLMPVDWARAIRHGVAKDGHRLLLMPSEEFFNFSNEDIGAIVAYIHSLPAVDRDDRGITLGPIGRALVVSGQVEFAFDKIDHAAERPSAPVAATREWGRVLVGACQGCHGPELSGGRVPGTPPEFPAARNLTPHETGLKGWTLEQFSAALRTGTRPDGTKLATFMPWQAYAGMSDTDVTAIWEYVRTVPAKDQGGR